MKKIQIRCQRLAGYSYYIEANDLHKKPLTCADAIKEFFNITGPFVLQITLAPVKGAKKFKVRYDDWSGYCWYDKNNGGWGYLYNAFGVAVKSLEPKNLTHPTTIYVQCTAAAEQSPCQSDSANADLST